MTNPSENDKGATMTQLWAWEYEGQDEVGYFEFGVLHTWVYAQDDPQLKLYRKNRTDLRNITNLRKAKVVDEDVETKTYLTTEQFITVWNSLDDEKSRELGKARSAARSAVRSAARSAVRYAARSAARSADLAVLVKDKITSEQFEILTKPWTGCGLSLYAEDWDEVLNPKVLEPTGFGAIVEAITKDRLSIPPTYRIMTHPHLWKKEKEGSEWVLVNTNYVADWSDFINPTIISEGRE